MIWPGLYVTYYYYASWAVLVGLAAEWLAFRLWLQFSWRKALLAAVVVNSLSAGLGLILLPVSTLMLSGFTELALGVQASTSGEWVATWLLVVLVNAAVEFWPLVWPFCARRSWRLLWIVLAANAMSVAFAGAASLPMAMPEFR